MTTRKGFVWDTTSRADLGDVSPEASDYPNVVDVGTLEGGDFNDVISDLDSDETYYYRAFGYDGEKYVYGEEVSFTTPPIAEITTEPVTNIGTTATFNGDVTEINSPNLVGSFKYSVVGSGVWLETDVEPITETGTFTQDVTGLTANTDYKVVFVVTYETHEQSGDLEYFTTVTQPAEWDTVNKRLVFSNEQTKTVRAYYDGITNRRVARAILNVTEESGDFTYELSANGGVNWKEVQLGELIDFTNRGHDLRIRITAQSAGVITRVECEYVLE